MVPKGVCPERGCIDPVMTDSLNCDAVTEIAPSAVINALTPSLVPRMRSRPSSAARKRAI